MNRSFLSALLAWPAFEEMPSVSPAEQARLCQLKREMEQRIARILKRNEPAKVQLFSDPQHQITSLD